MTCLWAGACLMILFPARTKTVCSHDDGVIHGLRAARPSPSGTTRLTTTTTTDRAKQPSTPETHTALCQNLLMNPRTSFSESLHQKDIGAEMQYLLVDIQQVLMHVWC